MSFDILVLGGSNYKNGELSYYTKKRCDFVSNELVKNNTKVNIHFSGGYNKKFNPTDLSHAKICRNYLNFGKENMCHKQFLHENTNNTVEEAIHFGNYFKNSENKIMLVTNDWHYDRVSYLFSKTFKFYEVNNFEIISLKSEDNEVNLLNEEKLKIRQLKISPFGEWKEWLVNNYYDKFLELKLIKKNDNDGKIIVNMRNQSSEYFFNKNKFNWEKFKNIFYNKYFSNEIPPFFVWFEGKVIGFIGCKTIEKNINDIGIMFFKEFQNLGMGKVSLKKYLTIYKKNYYREDRVIIAKVMKKNIGSFKIFKSNGFKVNESKNTDDIYHLTY